MRDGRCRTIVRRRDMLHELVDGQLAARDLAYFRARQPAWLTALDGG